MSAARVKGRRLARKKLAPVGFGWCWAYAREQSCPRFHHVGLSILPLRRAQPPSDKEVCQSAAITVLSHFQVASNFGPGYLNTTPTSCRPSHGGNAPALQGSVSGYTPLSDGGVGRLGEPKGVPKGITHIHADLAPAHHIHAGKVPQHQTAQRWQNQRSGEERAAKHAKTEEPTAYGYGDGYDVYGGGARSLYCQGNTGHGNGRYESHVGFGTPLTATQRKAASRKRRLEDLLQREQGISAREHELQRREQGLQEQWQEVERTRQEKERSTQETLAAEKQRLEAEARKREASRPQREEAARQRAEALYVKLSAGLLAAANAAAKSTAASADIATTAPAVVASCLRGGPPLEPWSDAALAGRPPAVGGAEAKALLTLLATNQVALLQRLSDASSKAQAASAHELEQQRRACEAERRKCVKLTAAHKTLTAEKLALEGTVAELKKAAEVEQRQRAEVADAQQALQAKNTTLEATVARLRAQRAQSQNQQREKERKEAERLPQATKEELALAQEVTRLKAARDACSDSERKTHAMLLGAHKSHKAEMAATEAQLHEQLAQAKTQRALTEQQLERSQTLLALCEQKLAHAEHQLLKLPVILEQGEEIKALHRELAGRKEEGEALNARLATANEGAAELVARLEASQANCERRGAENEQLRAVRGPPSAAGRPASQPGVIVAVILFESAVASAWGSAELRWLRQAANKERAEKAQLQAAAGKRQAENDKLKVDNRHLQLNAATLRAESVKAVAEREELRQKLQQQGKAAAVAGAQEECGRLRAQVQRLLAESEAVRSEVCTSMSSHHLMPCFLAPAPLIASALLPQCQCLNQARSRDTRATLVATRCA